MNILLWVLLGLAAGWIASVITNTNNAQGWMGDILMGILGALLGGFAMNLFGGTGITGFNIYSLILATAGAAVLIAAKKTFTRSY